MNELKQTLRGSAMKLHHSPEIWKPPDSNSRPPWNIFMIQNMLQGRAGEQRETGFAYPGARTIYI